MNINEIKNLEHAEIWLNNSGFCEWHWFDGFEYNELVAYIYKNSNKYEDQDEMIASFLLSKNQDLSDYGFTVIDQNDVEVKKESTDCYTVVSTENSFDDVPYENDFVTETRGQAIDMADKLFLRAKRLCQNNVNVIVIRKSDGQFLYCRNTRV